MIFINQRFDSGFDENQAERLFLNETSQIIITLFHLLGV